jgi:hypothetical protein
MSKIFTFFKEKIEDEPVAVSILVFITSVCCLSNDSSEIFVEFEFDFDKF